MLSKHKKNTSNENFMKSTQFYPKSCTAGHVAKNFVHKIMLKILSQMLTSIDQYDLVRVV